MLQDVSDLRRLHVHVDRHGDHSGFEGGKEKLHRFYRVRPINGNAAPRLKALPQEPSGERSNSPYEMLSFLRTMAAFLGFRSADAVSTLAIFI